MCEGDTITVNVTNHLRNGEGTSIHWHGFHVKNEQYMDRVGMLTQCPIPVGNSFTYKITGMFHCTYNDDPLQQPST